MEEVLVFEIFRVEIFLRHQGTAPNRHLAP